MRAIERTSQFKRDYKREAKGSHRKTLEGDFIDVITALANDQTLIEKHRDHSLTGEWKDHRDHSLTGEWKDHRDCHIKPDLVLIYRKPNTDSLQLVRLGSHSKLGF